MCASPTSSNYIAVGSSDSHIRIYDRRFLSLIDFTSPGVPTDIHTVPVKTFAIPSTEKRPFRVTSINYSPDETELLVSYSSDHLYLLNVTKEGIDGMQQISEKNKRSNANSPPPVRRLRLRGDWSDTGPQARPEREMGQRVTVGQARPQLQATIMHRMTEVLSRMLADPRTRVGLSAHGIHEVTQEHSLASAVQHIENLPQEPQGSSIVGAGPLPIAGPSTVTVAVRADRYITGDDDYEEEVVDDRTRVPDVVNPNIEDIDMETEIKFFDYLQMKFVGHRNARYIDCN